MNRPEIGPLLASGGARTSGPSEPVFSEPWQAQVFALAVRLGEAGYFTWKEWSEYLALELKAASDRRERDDGSRYYHHWLAALEQIVSAKGLSSLAEMSLRKDAWTDAYLHTPHGHPVELSSAHPHEPTPTGSDD